MIGELIDHYRVLELIGRGAMGVVYKGLDVNLDRPVAIKVMSVEARNDPSFVERFRQEARLQGALNHPNVALLFDYFIHDGAPVAVMEYIAGESLEELIRRRGAIPAREAIQIFKQALRGVAAAHRAGIIHRDLKPSNLMVTSDGIVKVMDFGIAKRQGVTGATKASTSIGSPLYMAPEQILGRAVDCRTDVYGLGITLYELLSGQRPFNTRGKAEYLVLDAHVNDTPEPPTVYRFGIPQPIVDAVMRALAKDPDARFQSADEFMRALPDVLAAPDAVAPPVNPPSAGAPPRVGPTGTVALPQPPFTDTVTLDYSPPEYVPTKVIDPPGAMAFDFSASTVLRQSQPLPSAASAPSAAATVPAAVAVHVAPAPASPMQRLRAHSLGIVAVLVVTVALGTLLRYVERLQAMPQASPGTQAPPSADAAAPLPAPASSPVDAAGAPPADSTASTAASSTADPATAVSATTTALGTTTAPARPDLAGTWRGAYFDASGRQLLRVVSLSINRVHDDGGIEGTLQYQAASGEGECQLHPRGSAYSAGRRRLQLSPESCSPHYPRELGVPLDFDRVNPEASTLKNGRIEAPTGEVITVRLERGT
jgi:serine/threonine protein kinase